MTRLSSAMVVIVAFVAALWAAPAFADDLVTGDQQTSPTTVERYVLSKIGDMTCTYNSKGLLVKRANSNTTVTFKYSGTKIKSYTSAFKHGRSQSKTSGKLTYNKKGLLTKLVVKDSTGKTTDAYKYANGKVSKFTHSYTNRKAIRYACTYDAYGRLATQNASGGDTTKITFGYDEKGNLESATYRVAMGGSERSFANTYNKAGRLTKRVTTITSAGSYSTTTKYSYKKIQVPVQYADQVDQQQWSLLNPQVSFSYPLNY